MKTMNNEQTKASNLKSMIVLSLAAFALTTVSAFASTGNEPVSVENEIVRALSSQAAANNSQGTVQQQPKHRSLLNKEIREPKAQQ